MEYFLMSNEMIDSSFLDGEILGIGLEELNWSGCNTIWNSKTTKGKKRKHSKQSQNLLFGAGSVTSNSQGRSDTKIQRRETNLSNCVTSCQQEGDLADNLASDLDETCNLSGLGVDFNSSYSNISDALLTLPSITVYKQELTSPTVNSKGEVSPIGVNSSYSRLSNKSQGHSPNHIEQLYSSYEAGTNETKSHIERNKNDKYSQNLNDNIHKNCLVIPVVPDTSTGSPPLQISDDCRFQYVLAAATSVATKVKEETLTYLNQGQAYEIRLKKLGNLFDYSGKTLKSVIRLCFHERRLQSMETEQISAWEASRPGDRIVEVDLPLSYGMFNLVQDPFMLNTIEFLWDPRKDVGVYIKVNCISTEFTPNKHGGEKGVPFRIQVETFMHGDKLQRRVHSASCQVKVFKLKGADRKHKQDKVKIQKLSLNEQEKYQPSYECTVLRDLPNTTDCVFETSVVNSSRGSSPVTVTFTSSSVEPMFHHTPVLRKRATRSPVVGKRVVVTFNKQEGLCRQFKHRRTQPRFRHNIHSIHISGLCSRNSSPLKGQPLIEPEIQAGQLRLLHGQDVQQDFTNNSLQTYNTSLPVDATEQQISLWLQNHRFSSHLHTFSNYSTADLLRLSRDDLIQICGLADGIRLFNALHRRVKTIYMCVKSSPTVYHAIYLASLSSKEMTTKIAVLLDISSVAIYKVYLLGPQGILVLVSDELVLNIKDGAAYRVETMEDCPSDRLCIILKPSTN